jgi:N-acetylglucosaminyl-diphospho-decaprenol L-rhamnosyltransferase
MDLSILIVNWNSAHYLRACLRSIYEQVKEIEFEVIVVDNASYDGSEAIVQGEFPATTFIQSEENLGFAKANNLAYRKSSGSALLFLNPDTEVIDTAVEGMYHQLRSRPLTGAVGCRVVNSDRSLQVQYVQAFPTIWNQVLTSDLLFRIWPKSKLGSLRPQGDARGDAIEVDVIAGSSLMVKRSVFAQVGLFCEDYFMYAEDVDLCYRIKRAGYAIQYVGKGTIVHHIGRSSSSKEETHFSSVMQRESLAMFFKKTRGAHYAELFRATTTAAALLRLFLIACAAPSAGRLVARERLRTARQKWHKLLRWSLGLERWAAIVTPALADKSRNS